MRKTASWFTGVVVLVLAALFILRGALARTLSQICVRKLTGLTADVRPTYFGWTRAQFEVLHFTCSNLHASGSAITADVPKMLVDYEPWSVLRRELHVYSISCEIRNIAISRQAPPPKSMGPGRASRPATSPVRLDALHLKLNGSFSYDRSSASGDVQRVNGQLETTLYDVRDIDALRVLFSSPKGSEALRLP